MGADRGGLDRMGRPSAGFTLIELMIVIAILGIIASIAVPHYREFVLQSRRDDARSSLQTVISQQILFYGNFGSTYTTTVGALGYGAHGGDSTHTLSRDEFYEIGLDPCGGNIADCVIATAVARGGQLEDEDCRSFSLNSRGTEAALDKDGGATTAVCWE